MASLAAPASSLVRSTPFTLTRLERRLLPASTGSAFATPGPDFCPSSAIVGGGGGNVLGTLASTAMVSGRDWPMLSKASAALSALTR